MTLLLVPAGEFIMGSTDQDPEAAADEKPQHSVYVDAFWIDKTEVSNAMYAPVWRRGHTACLWYPGRNS
jgi:formylglycine-generating enzyme required for sulfatase activity